MPKYLLTVTIFLLSITSHISAQVMDSKVTLEGLRDIGLIVKYGQADGLESAEQPAVLQTLQDRARELLRQGEVTLLQSTNEADMAGRARLVFTVHLKKKSDIGPAMEVEGRLYQRVRLMHDPAKELELATWIWSMGPRVPNETLLSLFEENVTKFVTDYRAANPISPPVENRKAEAPAQLSNKANALQGLKGVRFIVGVNSNQPEENGRQIQVEPRFRDPEFSTMVRIEVENRLKQAGIPMLNREDSPLLFVSVNLSPPELRQPSIFARASFWQRVSLVRDPRKKTSALTWESSTSENLPITEETVFKVLNRQLDEFIKAYSAANPKHVGSGTDPILQARNSLGPN